MCDDLAGDVRLSATIEQLRGYLPEQNSDQIKNNKNR